MRSPWIAGLIFCILPQAASVRAGETDTPTVVVRIRSLDDLLQNLNLVVKLVGQEEAANQIEGLVKSKIGKQGLQGIDPTRPFGAYVRFGKTLDDIGGAILIPMIDEKPFLALLDTLDIKYERDKDGIYTHKPNPAFSVYFRFAHRYLYVTSVNTDSIADKNLVEPAKALAIADSGMISVVARVDQIPAAAKQFAVAQLEDAMLSLQKKEDPSESKAQREFRIARLREAYKLGSSVIRDAAEIRFDLDLVPAASLGGEKDVGAKTLAVNFTVTGTPGSELAKTVQQLGGLRSPLAGAGVMGGDDAAFRGAVHVALPETLKDAFAAAVAEAARKSDLALQSEDKKKQAAALFETLLPSAKSGEFHVVAAVRGSREKHYTFVAALKLLDGDKVGKTVRALVEDSLKGAPASERAKTQLDFASVGMVKIHRFELPKSPRIDKLLDDAAGDNHLYVAFRDDAVFLALGKEALATLKSALPQKDNTPSQPLVFDFDAARMAPLMAQTQAQKDLAAKLFPEGQNGRVRLSISGGSSLNARLQIQLNVVEFLVKMQNDKRP